MAKDIADFNQTGISVTEYENVKPGTSTLTKHLKLKNTVTTLQSDSKTKSNLEKLCNGYKNANTTYFSYGGPSQSSPKISSIKLGYPIANAEGEYESRSTSDGIVFGILNVDFEKLNLNENQKEKASAKKYNNIREYVCAEFSMDDLLTSISKSKSKQVISHLIISMKGDKLNYTPKKMGLTNKYMTAKQLRNKVIDFLNKNHPNTPIPNHFNDFFNAIDKSTSRTPQSITTYEISLEHISMIKSEIFEIFSAYDLLHRQKFKNFIVFFPEEENTPLYDYVILNDYEISRRFSSYNPRRSFQRYFISVKNNISVSKIEAKKIKNNADPFKYGRTTGNVVKPSSFFQTVRDLKNWKAWIENNKHRINGDKVVHTSDPNNNRVYRIFSPVAGNKSANFTIGAIKNLLEMESQNGSVGLVYTSNYFRKVMTGNSWSNLNKDVQQEFANIFVTHILPTIDSNYTKVEFENYTENGITVSADNQKHVIKKLLNKPVGNVTVSDIQIICEKILEYNSKPRKSQVDLTAHNQTDNTNFVDIISYLVNRDSKKVIFSSAKYNTRIGNNLQIYFQHIIAPDTDVLSNTWIPLRSKDPGKELLGLDLTFYTKSIPELSE